MSATSAHARASAAGDLLYGVRAIAEHLGVNRRQAQYLAEAGKLPVFKVGNGATIFARRSRLDAWLREVETEGAARK
ncbi:hypothetical protein M446_1163 [Methylobacterium sp. 4-46]|uniref:helix-turn-helix domain-containing protein n=1 Tax=unclassified Methylobacterium TaxID=2615210 RepID=UPI000165C88F|nr:MULTISPECIES: helix-turn-helix domain-containing protein [Methylobacterium]ACA15689.1 hypothetical protein M446_1163 [Methylobacterium sp. 4-46]WFT81400.1 helix-turn-helix domain-containing protein [Methylobacterium nodulans]